MGHKRMTTENRTFSDYMAQMEKIISMITTEKPIERIRTLERKIDEVEKIQAIEGSIEQLKEQMWTVKEVLTTTEASVYLGVSESYIYKLTSSKLIPHYKPNGKLVYFNRKELCKWVMRNRVQTTGTTPRTENEAL